MPNYVSNVFAILMYIALILQSISISISYIQYKGAERVRQMIPQIIVILLLMSSIYFIGLSRVSIMEINFTQLHPFDNLFKGNRNLATILFFIFNCILFISIYFDLIRRFSKFINSLTSVSIQEAMYRMPMGNLFYNYDGRIMFINKSMKKFLEKNKIHFYSGVEVWKQILEKSDDSIVLDSLSQKNTSKNGDNIFKTHQAGILDLGQENIYELFKTEIGIHGQIYSNITVMDITEEYNLAKEIEAQNIELENMNQEIETIIKNIEETQKEQSILEIKNRIHDIMGQRLSILHQVLENYKHIDISVPELKEMLDNIWIELQEHIWENHEKIIERIINTCSLVHTQLIMNGKLIGTNRQKSIMLQIIREGVTNAIRHGTASEIFVDIWEDDKNIFLQIKNNGTIPTKNFTENDGIRGMRRRLNEVEGTLTISTEEMFTILSIMPKNKEQEIY